ncbi:MAG TPA: RNA methyltransferase [Thermoanaerobaculia bacterium]|nr:RNA methyltransferase [Thermoanaerobaculia bacterium]
MPQPSDERITSRQNRWFRRFLEASRSHEDEIVLEGPKAVRDAIARGWTPLAFALAPENVPPAGGVPSFVFAPALTRELTDTRHPQGVLALFERPRAALEPLLEVSSPLLVVLDGVQDPGNVGTIVRLAAAFEATGVVLTEGTADPFAPKALRASAGAALLVPIVEAPSATLVRLLAERDIPLWAATADGAPSPSLAPPAALALGSEGSGVSAEILAAARHVSIPISPAVDSINVAAAAAILLHQMRRK